MHGTEEGQKVAKIQAKWKEIHGLYDLESYRIIHWAL